MKNTKIVIDLDSERLGEIMKDFFTTMSPNIVQYAVGRLREKHQAESDPEITLESEEFSEVDGYTYNFTFEEVATDKGLVFGLNADSNLESVNYTDLTVGSKYLVLGKDMSFVFVKNSTKELDTRLGYFTSIEAAKESFNQLQMAIETSENDSPVLEESTSNLSVS